MKKIALYFVFLIFISSCKKKTETPVSDNADKVAGIYKVKTEIIYDKAGFMSNSDEISTVETIIITKVISDIVNISGTVVKNTTIKNVKITYSNGNYIFSAPYSTSVSNPSTISGKISGGNLTFSIIPKNDFKYTTYKAIKNIGFSLI